MKSVFSAFIKFQNELKPIKEEGWNPHFKSTFADLSSILKVVTPLLTKHELGVLQTCRIQGEGTILQTRIVHTSGEEIVSEMILPFLADPQKFGSLLTYYKRYQLQATLGVATKDEDDDGAGAGIDGEMLNKADFDYLKEGATVAGMKTEALLKLVGIQSGRALKTYEELSRREYDYAIKVVKSAIEKASQGKAK